ncbi:MAG: glycosyltransferase family 9 protein [Planctomycetota bacterium]|nr:glycosyltransferase family 9 protein [Planctomycetota bacterium]
MKTLCCFFARVGDLVMLTPFLRALAAQGPLDLCARPWARALLAHEPWLGQIHTLAKPNLPAWQDWLLGGARWRLGRQLRAQEYERVLIFSSETPRIAAWVRGVVTRERLQVVPVPSDGHAVDAFRAAAADIGLEISDPWPRLSIPDALRRQAQQRLRRYGQRVIAVQAGSSLTHRWWRKQPNLKGLAPEQWARLCSEILAAGDGDAVILLGSAPERREAQSIIGALPERWRERAHDLTGRVPLDELPALLAACKACISVDTGPAHIAAAVGCPLLVIFGPTDPRRFAPRGEGPIVILEGEAACRPCHGTPLFRTCRDNRCLSTLPAARCAQAWRTLQQRIAESVKPLATATAMDGA